MVELKILKAIAKFNLKQKVPPKYLVLGINTLKLLKIETNFPLDEHTREPSKDFIMAEYLGLKIVVLPGRLNFIGIGV